jgi:hypothetical protein
MYVNANLPSSSVPKFLKSEWLQQIDALKTGQIAGRSKFQAQSANFQKKMCWRENKNETPFVKSGVSKFLENKPTQLQNILDVCDIQRVSIPGYTNLTCYLKDRIKFKQKKN